MTRLFAVVVLALALGCDGKKAEKAEAEEKAAQAKSTKPGEEPLNLPAFWDDSAYVKVRDDSKCPDGMWALFAGAAPGETDVEKKSNTANKAAIAKDLRGKTFLAHQVGPTYVTLGEYDTGKGELPVTVKSVIDCTDSIGRVAFSFGSKNEARLPDGKDAGQYMWFGEPLTFPLKVKFTEYRQFTNANKAGLEARIVFQLDKAEVHKKLIRNEISAEERAEMKRLDIPDPGDGMEDWGAGRMVRAKVLGVRIASKGGREELVAHRP